MATASMPDRCDMHDQLGEWVASLVRVADLTQVKSVSAVVQLPTGDYDVTITKRE